MSFREGQPGFRIGFWLGDVSLEYGGIGPYALRILDALLAEHEPGWHLVLLCESLLAEQLARVTAGYRSFTEIQIIPSAIPASSSHIADWIDGLQLDLLHFPTQTFLHRNLQVPYRVTMHDVEEPSAPRFRVPYVVTMHDVQELHFPENFAPVTRAIRAIHYWKALEGARGVIVSFDHVKRDLITYFGILPTKIHLCPIPFNFIRLTEASPSASQDYASKYAAWRPFLLYPSYTWPHKNHLQLIRALARTKRAGIEHLQLICTGGTNHPHYARIVAEIEAHSLSSSVFFAGIIPEDELRWLYQHAALVTIPTRYEAGSFPLYEAMILRAPVICSNVTSLPETMNDARFVFDPLDTEGLADLISRILVDENLCRANRENSSQQVQRLRQVSAGPCFYLAYRRALQGV